MDGCGNEQDGVFPYDEQHEVRCCSDFEIEGFNFNADAECNLWTRSRLLGKCYNMKAWPVADCLCKKHGARLCTQSELQRDCTEWAGCGHDREIVWSSVSFG